MNLSTLGSNDFRWVLEATTGESLGKRRISVQADDNAIERLGDVESISTSLKQDLREMVTIFNSDGNHMINSLISKSGENAQKYSGVKIEGEEVPTLMKKNIREIKEKGKAERRYAFSNQGIDPNKTLRDAGETASFFDSEITNYRMRDMPLYKEPKNAAADKSINYIIGSLRSFPVMKDIYSNILPRL